MKSNRVILALGAAALAVSLAACKQEPVTAEPEAASTDFVAENPTEPAVPVDLPTTAMTTAAEAEPTAAQ